MYVGTLVAIIVAVGLLVLIPIAVACYLAGMLLLNSK